MAPARNLLRQHGDSYGGCFLECNQEKASLISGLMAKEEEGGGGEEVGTSSKQGDDTNYKGWLQLGIGGRQSGGPDAAVDPMSSSSSGMELSLFPARPLLPTAATSIVSVQPMFPWGLQYPAPTTMTSYNFELFGSQPGSLGSSGSELRVVSPPLRPQTGVWFELKAAQNQGKEPSLPQIPKSYLRIKDGRMTVQLLMKYLANKLGLDDESQVEITCRGQKLHPILTLQHIRDNVWCTRATTVMMPLDLPISDHVMTLQYSRRA